MKKNIILILFITVIGVGFIIYKTLNKSNIMEIMTSGDKHEQLENGISSANFNGDDLFEKFISNGGAKNDQEVVTFLTENVLSNENNIDINVEGSGCSTFQTVNKNGEYIFGRNFDWQHSNALVIVSTPKIGYKSISTVNMDFITSINRTLSNLPDQVKTLVALYAPLDGMNEKGLTVSVNMIEDSATINQNTSKPDITTTTAIRLLLNKAATVEEAIEILESYDMHSSMGWMVHFMIADNTGKSVAVEYVNNEMKVIDTKMLTNFYLDRGNKYGIGSSQSHERYEILEKTLKDNETMEMEDVKNTLDSVSKDNFNEFESTEWSIVYNQTTLEVHYYHRENYTKKYTFKLN